MNKVNTSIAKQAMNHYAQIKTCYFSEIKINLY